MSVKLVINELLMCIPLIDLTYNYWDTLFNVTQNAGMKFAFSAYLRQIKHVIRINTHIAWTAHAYLQPNA